jgi:hypothetical protein
VDTPASFVVHTLLQAPQLFGSMFVGTGSHAPLHTLVDVLGQHTLSTHFGVEPLQTFPHVPQLFGSCVVSAQ